MTERKPFLDNLRWATVLLVVGYHVGYLYNGVGIMGAIPGAESIAWADLLCSAVYPWFMVLLFTVSGICARYALEKKSGKAFLKERARKLIVPSTLGLFLIHWITGYLNIRIGGGLAYMPSFLVYPISVISGVGPLWFAQMLFLFSALLLLIRKLDREDRLWKLGGKIKGEWVMPLAFLLWAAAQVGNLPVLTVYRFGIYSAAFFLGYYVLSHAGIQQWLARRWLILTICAVFWGTLYLERFSGENFTEDAVLKHLYTNGYAWLTVLALLGLGRRYWNRETKVTRYLAKNSFGFYVLHYPVVMAVCCGLQYGTVLPAEGKYFFGLILTFLGTFLLNELIKRIPIIRWMVLGIKG